MSERDYILSDEYLNDDSYLDFKNSFSICVNIASPKPKVVQSPKAKIEKLKPLNKANKRTKSEMSKAQTLDKAE